MFLVPNGRTYLDLDAKDKLLYFTSLNPETRKIEEKIGPKNIIFFRWAEKSPKLDLNPKKC